VIPTSTTHDDAAGLRFSGSGPPATEHGSLKLYLATLRAGRQAGDPQKAQQLIADTLPSVIASVLEPAELVQLVNLKFHPRLHPLLVRLPEFVEERIARLKKSFTS